MHQSAEFSVCVCVCVLRVRIRTNRSALKWACHVCNCGSFVRVEDSTSVRHQNVFWAPSGVDPEEILGQLAAQELLSANKEHTVRCIQSAPVSACGGVFMYVLRDLAAVVTAPHVSQKARGPREQLWFQQFLPRYVIYKKPSRKKHKPPGFYKRNRRVWTFSFREKKTLRWKNSTDPETVCEAPETETSSELATELKVVSCIK